MVDQAMRFDPNTGQPISDPTTTGTGTGARFDPTTGQPIPKFNPTTGQQNWYDMPAWFGGSTPAQPAAPPGSPPMAQAQVAPVAEFVP